MQPVVDLTSSTRRGSRRRHRKSHSCRAKHNAAFSANFIRRVREVRVQEMQNRACDDVYENRGNNKNISPSIFVLDMTDERNITGADTNTALLYALHGSKNKWVYVSEQPNVSNPGGVEGGGKGLFARKPIPAGTRICPYVGIKCGPGQACRTRRNAYRMRCHTACSIDACDCLYDIGYLGMLRPLARVKRPCPPNYGRYCNTIDSTNPAQRSLAYNCHWEGSDEGYEEVWLYASVDIATDTELLSDYGNEYSVGGFCTSWRRVEPPSTDV